MAMRRVLVPMGLEPGTRIALRSLTWQDVVDLGWLVHGFRAHRIIAGLSIPTNAGGVAKEIDHVLVDGLWRLLQNCRVYQSAQFLNTNRRIVGET